MESNLTAILSNAGLRVTSQRLVVFKALKAATHPLSIVELVEVCPAIDKVSVYRTIRLFSGLSIVTVVTHGWKQSYELSGLFAPHHHHLICTICARAIEIKSEKIEAIIHEVADSHNFTPASHHFEVTGVCSECNARK